MGIRDRISKALALPAGTTTLSQGQIEAMQNAPQSGMTAVPLERDIQDAIVPFPAATPLIPALINSPRQDGRADPRRYEYPVAWNLQLTEQRAIPFAVLRSVSDSADIVRKCIEVVKSAVAGMKWHITLTDEAVRRVMEEQEIGQTQAAKIARDTLQPEMTRATDFWISPDRMNGMSFQEWIGMALEEMLVIDALSIYPNRTQDNKNLHSLEILDGTTIKPLLNQRGSRPIPPHPAFQQILWGFPRGEFTATADANGEFTQDDLIYAPRNRRTNTPYGYSPVERCLPLVDLYMKRLQWLRTEFTDGVAPDVLMQTDATFGSNPELLRGYEQVFNDALSGNMEQRRRMRILPQGMTPIFPPGADSKYSSEFDEYLIKQICGHFGVLPTQLGMTSSGTLGETGHQQGEASTAETIGLRPVIMWLQDLLNQLSYRFLGMPKDLMFLFSDGSEADEMAQATRRQLEFFSGLKPLNEIRSEMGLPLFTFAEADQPLVVAGSHLTPVASAFEAVAVNADGSVTPPASPSPTDTVPEDEDTEINPKESSNTEINPEGSISDTSEDLLETEAKSAELTQFIRWTKGDRKREFAFKTVDTETADRLNHLAQHDQQSARDLAGVLRKAGGVRPKVPRGREPFPASHPARKASDRLVALYAKRLRSVGSVNSEAIAEAYLANPSPDPRQWLAERGVRVYGADAVDVLRDLFWESAWMGTVSARIQIQRGRDRQRKSVIVKTSLTLTASDWEGWKPGDPQAAQQLLADGQGSGMRQLLDRAGLEIKGLDNTALDRISNVLSSAKDQGLSARETAKQIRDVVSDPKRAEMIAHTEMARAVNASNVDEYRNTGVTQVDWETAGDEGVCEECMGNEAGNPYEIDSAPEAPAHPNCGCGLIPVSFEEMITLTPEEEALVEGMIGDDPQVKPEEPEAHSDAETEMVSEADVVAAGEGYVEQTAWTRPHEIGNWQTIPDSQIDALAEHMVGRLTAADLAMYSSETQRQMMLDVNERAIKGTAQQLRSTSEGTLFVNGDFSIQLITELNEIGLQRVFEGLDRARQVADPAGGKMVNVFVVNDLGKDTFGDCIIAGREGLSSRIRLDAENLMTNETLGNSWWSQGNLDTSKGFWTVIHEYGHATDKSELPDSKPNRLYGKWKNKGVGEGLSRYGSKNKYEGYAESFADWTESKGMSTNPATQAYAEYHGWRKP